MVIGVMKRDIQKDTLWNLLYADGMFLRIPAEVEFKNGICRWKVQLQKYGQKVKSGKIESLRKENEFFGYLESYASNEREIQKDVNERVSTTWSFFGVLCDIKIPRKRK